MHTASVNSASTTAPLRGALAAVMTDEEGYLLEPTDWDEGLAEDLSRKEGLELGDEHWQLIRFMRDYYDEHRIAADTRHVVRFMAEEMGYGSKARNHLFELFPYGYVKQACKIAGMRRPRAWSTG
jgi:tRNA 2-thiouridine synthesizing protein E